MLSFPKKSLPSASSSGIAPRRYLLSALKPSTGLSFDSSDIIAKLGKETKSHRERKQWRQMVINMTIIVIIITGAIAPSQQNTHPKTSSHLRFAMFLGAESGSSACDQSNLNGGT